MDFCSSVKLPTVLSINLMINRSLPESQLGVHRYELVIKIKQADRITSIAPRYVKVSNRAVDMDSRARLTCYPRGSFYPLSPVRHHDGSEDH